MWGAHDTYAEVSCGDITAEVVRFAYWDDRDGRTDVEQTFEVLINGADNGGGVCDVYAEDAETLRALAAVSTQAALLLDEAREQHGTKVQHA
jgi:ethanolamine utilization microcompartment shell protein EutL